MASCSHSNPRKFSEKIALHRQKEAEEKAEYDKIMSECAMVKGGRGGGGPTVPTVHHSRLIHPPPAYGALGPDVTSRLLPPNISNSVNRHGSLPNVNAAMQSLDHSGDLLHNGGLPCVLDQSSQQQLHHLPSAHVPQHVHHHHQQLVNNTNGGSPMSGHHISLREQQTGPIRSAKSRIDTSPYGSSYHLLSPPNPVDWRRTVSDSSLHQSVHGSHENVSKHNTGPSRHSSPHKKSLMEDGNRFGISSSSQKQGVQNFSGYLLPNDPSDKKPGSLPDLSSFAGVSSSLHDRSSGGGCSSSENSPPGIPNGSSGGHPGMSSNPSASHLSHNPSSSDLSNSPWSPDGGGGEYGRSPNNNNQLSYSTAQVSSPIATYGGRCTSPIDVVGAGSPHSPSGNPMSPTSPQLNSIPNNNASYEDLETGHYSQEQVDLNREFQRFTMMDSWDNSAQYSQNYYFRGNPSRYEQNENQPMNELVNFLTNMDSKGPIHPDSSSCAQTPSGIPDIILTDDAGTDQDLQGLAMSTALECVNEDSLKADLGKLDDSMLRLLTESAGSDQAIADAVTEEHLKLI